MYINDLVDGVHSDIKLVADDTSIFSVVEDKDEATKTEFGMKVYCTNLNVVEYPTWKDLESRPGKSAALDLAMEDAI